jgi:hypothetical protein
MTLHHRQLIATFISWTAFRIIINLFASLTRIPKIVSHNISASVHPLHHVLSFSSSLLKCFYHQRSFVPILRLCMLRTSYPPFVLCPLAIPNMYSPLRFAFAFFFLFSDVQLYPFHDDILLYRTVSLLITFVLSHSSYAPMLSGSISRRLFLSSAAAPVPDEEACVAEPSPAAQMA